MSRIAYVNGRYLPVRQAQIAIEDRGFQFADGVYEVFPIYAGHIVNHAWHLQRLSQSLGALRIDWPLPPAVLTLILKDMLRRNRIIDGGMLYLQITRGVSPRNHAFPVPGVRSTLVVTARPVDMAARHAQAEIGVRVISVPENRWARRDIKSVSLLANILAKQGATERDAAEALFVNDRGILTEGASSTFWMITREGVLTTHPLGHDILPGVTRRAIFAMAPELGLQTDEREFSLAETLQAREAFLTSATNFVMPVIQIDAQIIANGKPGAISLALRKSYIERIE